MSLAEKIRELRVARNWTQQELANQADLDRGYIANLESLKVIHRPSAEALLKIADAFDINPDVLYQAAGYIRKIRENSLRPENPVDVLNHLKFIMPLNIPVYSWEVFPHHPGDNIDPAEYVCKSRSSSPYRNLEGYIIPEGCLETQMHGQEIVIVDRNGVIEHDDIIVCLVNNEFHMMRVRKVANSLWAEDNHVNSKFEDCREPSPVVEHRVRPRRK